MNNILVIAAHPDDETLGCGGTIKRFTEEGDRIYIYWLGDGLAARGEVDQEEALALKQAQGNVCRLLGAIPLLESEQLQTDNLPLPDNKFDSVPLLDIVKRVELAIEFIQPEIIFTHSPKDLNIDHRIVAQATITATRPGTCVVEEIYQYEVPSSTEWAFGAFGNFRPNHYIDVSNTINIKLSAMAFYDTEVRENPHPRSLDHLEALARIRGGECGNYYAEAFETLRILR